MLGLATVATVSLADGEVLAKLAISDGHTGGLVVRGTFDGDRFAAGSSSVGPPVTIGDDSGYFAQMTGGSDQLALVKRVAGVETVLDVGTLGAAVLAGADYGCRLSVVTTPTCGARLAWKVWPAGEAEPPTWSLVATDATPAPGVLDVAGRVGVHGSGVVGPVELEVDDFVAVEYAAATAVPGAAGDLVGIATSSRIVDLAWVDESDDEWGFVIQSSLDGVAWTDLTTDQFDYPVDLGQFIAHDLAPLSALERDPWELWKKYGLK